MEVGIRELRNHTAQVIDAVRSGERVVLTSNGEPIADIVRTSGATAGYLGPGWPISCRPAPPILVSPMTLMS
jgi:hypothetical protein